MDVKAVWKSQPWVEHHGTSTDDFPSVHACQHNINLPYGSKLP